MAQEAAAPELLFADPLLLRILFDALAKETNVLAITVRNTADHPRRLSAASIPQNEI
jgi:hypothetical protein